MGKVGDNVENWNFKIMLVVVMLYLVLDFGIEAEKGNS